LSAEEDTPLRSFTIYLLREGIARPQDALRSASKLKSFTVGSGSTKIGELYVQASRPWPPRWAALFSDYLDLAQLGRVSTSSAVFLVAVKGRTFALTFGQGRHLLVPGGWEERFGLRVALNCIEENHLRSIDKQTFDAISRHTRVQSSREASPPDFGLDIEQDLLRAVTGTPKDEQFGKKLSGMDALHALARVELENLKGLLATYLEKFHDDTYRRVFPWVDHIAEVSNSQTKGELDELLVQRLQSENLDRCWLAVPEIVDWADISGFRYGFGRRSPEYHDLHFPEFLGSLPDGVVEVGTLRKRHAYCIGDEGQEIDEWPIYQCIYCELDHNGDSYLLSAGKWYRVNRNFVNEVNDSFQQFPRYPQSLPQYNDSSETVYCERVAKESSGMYALMDRKTIQIGGGYSKVEFCDLFSRPKDLIHIKRYGGSSVLSHLFAQGLVAGEAFRSDAKFRRDVNELLPKTHRLANPDQPPNAADFQIVFAIVSDSPDELILPFFSRINLRHAARRLQAYGFRIALAKISVDETLSKLQRYQ